MSRSAFVPDSRRSVLRNFLFRSIKSSAQHQKLFEGPLAAIPSAIAPKEGEIVVTKHRVSAFAGTDLAMILRANEIDTLVLFGIATSGVVLSTLLEAAVTENGDARHGRGSPAAIAWG